MTTAACGCERSSDDGPDEVTYCCRVCDGSGWTGQNIDQPCYHCDLRGWHRSEYDSHDVRMVDGRGYCQECHPGKGWQRHTDYALDEVAPPMPTADKSSSSTSTNKTS